MHMHGSRANFILSVAKLSSLSGCYSVLYSPSLPPALFTGIYPDCAHKFTDVFVMQAPYLCLKTGLITKKYSFSHIQSRRLHNERGGLNTYICHTRGICRCQYAPPNCASRCQALGSTHGSQQGAVAAVQRAALPAQPSPGCRATAYLSASWSCRSFAARPLR